MEAKELRERGPDVPPAAPRRRHTDSLPKRTRDPSPPKRQSLMMGLFGRSNTTPTIPKDKDRVTRPRDGKGKEPEREPSRRAGDAHRSRRPQRTPSEEDEHRRRKAERRASRAGDYPPTPPPMTASPVAASPAVLPMEEDEAVVAGSPPFVPEALPSPVDELPERQTIDDLFEEKEKPKDESKSSGLFGSLKKLVKT
ncbi:hypothetical protein UCRNP2_5435 [Neofusicoccum parvum UCRNP2]|uniref:Uncharacterized protein n=1 Tax=Botryosphaeria parva (strain UCR-NP2) TaxID=1287680 RepID=R1GHQ9_BOTPV|nr:hypothetical protein UCRNP2_5435 [Neofusicoccum parvum UCRNP2]